MKCSTSTLNVTSACPLKFFLAMIVLCLGGVTGLPAESLSKEPGPASIITAGADWVPLTLELDIQPGSALDFSTMGFSEAPAGKHGRVIARPDGQFAFEDS